MTQRPIEEAHSSILRGSHKALLRAATRAREVAEKTGTTLVVSRNGVIEHLQPKSMQSVGVQESPLSYGTDK
jgi:hypothetical protein